MYIFLSTYVRTVDSNSFWSNINPTARQHFATFYFFLILFSFFVFSFLSAVYFVLFWVVFDSVAFPLEHLRLGQWRRRHGGCGARPAHAAVVGSDAVTGSMFAGCVCLFVCRALAVPFSSVPRRQSVELSPRRNLVLCVYQTWTQRRPLPSQHVAHHQPAQTIQQNPNIHNRTNERASERTSERSDSRRGY